MAYRSGPRREDGFELDGDATPDIDENSYMGI